MSLSDNSNIYFILELEPVDSPFLYEFMYSFAFICYIILNCILDILNIETYETQGLNPMETGDIFFKSNWNG